MPQMPNIMSKPIPPPMSLFAIFFAFLRRELRIAYRRRGELLKPPMFFIITTALFPLATNPNSDILYAIAPAVIWTAALLATSLGIARIFAIDYVEGVLEQLLLTPHPVSIIVLAKLCGHWLVCGLPLIIISPLLAAMFGLSTEFLPELIGGLLLGTPALSLLGALGAALTLSARGGALLLTMLILPLYIPILIFGSAAVRISQLGLDSAAPLLWLGVILLLTLALVPLAIAAALRVGLDG